MLTDAQVYCMTSMIYLFRPPLTAKSHLGKRRKQTPNIYYLPIRMQSSLSHIFTIFLHASATAICIYRVSLILQKQIKFC